MSQLQGRVEKRKREDNGNDLNHFRETHNGKSNWRRGTVCCSLLQCLAPGGEHVRRTLSGSWKLYWGSWKLSRMYVNVRECTWITLGCWDIFFPSVFFPFHLLSLSLSHTYIHGRHTTLHCDEYEPTPPSLWDALGALISAHIYLATHIQSTRISRRTTQGVKRVWKVEKHHSYIYSHECLHTYIWAHTGICVTQLFSTQLLLTQLF